MNLIMLIKSKKTNPQLKLLLDRYGLTLNCRMYNAFASQNVECFEIIIFYKPYVNFVSVSFSLII